MMSNVWMCMCLFLHLEIILFNSDQSAHQCMLVLARDLYMHGRAHHLLLTQVIGCLRIAFLCLCKRDTTDPWPISILANANIYYSLTNTVQYSPLILYIFKMKL